MPYLSFLNELEIVETIYDAKAVAGKTVLWKKHVYIFDEYGLYAKKMTYNKWVKYMLKLQQNIEELQGMIDVIEAKRAAEKAEEDRLRKNANSAASYRRCKARQSSTGNAPRPYKPVKRKKSNK